MEVEGTGLQLQKKYYSNVELVEIALRQAEIDYDMKYLRTMEEECPVQDFKISKSTCNIMYIGKQRDLFEQFAEAAKSYIEEKFITRNNARDHLLKDVPFSIISSSTASNSTEAFQWGSSPPNSSFPGS